MIRSSFSSVRDRIDRMLVSAVGPNGEFDRPVVDAEGRSTVPGIYVIGDLAGSPVIKLAMADGVRVIESLVREQRSGGGRDVPDDVVEVIVVGAGAAGLNAALEAKSRGLSVIVLERGEIANTIENFPEGKWVYAEPDDVPPRGKLWLDGATKEDLIARWHETVREAALDVRTGEELLSIERGSSGIFTLVTSGSKYRARYVVLATGQRGNPRSLGVPGEEQEWVYHRLYSPKHYRDEDILVVGGGNSAVEAAVTLAEANRVVLSYRGTEVTRVFKENRQRLDDAVAADRVELVLGSNVTSFGDRTAQLSLADGASRSVRCDHAFVLIGADLPREFLRGLGLRLEGDWSGSLGLASGLVLTALCGLWFFGGAWGSALVGPGAVVAAASIAGLFMRIARSDRYALLGASFLVWYSVYGIKVGHDSEFWPFRGWAYNALSFHDRPWSFWYTVMYTALMTIFGIGALYRWGVKRGDRFQIWRFVSLLTFQWVMFFLVPELLFQYAIEYRWVGERLATDPSFAEQPWRSYGLVYAWPLFFYTFFYDPHWFWVCWGVFLSFVLIPVLVVFHGKRYCSWICGCGGLAETFGDRWRHRAPKGSSSIAWERMGAYVLVIAALVTVLMLVKDIISFVVYPADRGMWFYRIIVDVWLVGILPVTLYPFLGGKIWCRYWCPLAKIMEILSRWYTRKQISRFSIEANDKCIACGECSRYCQVGIPVMQYALKQQPLTNETSSCIGCGICVTVCPMDVLSFGNGTRGRERLNVVR